MQEKVTEAKMMERNDEKKTTARVMPNKSRTSWGSRIWKRCSPLQLLRFIRDSYVTGCISAADSAPLNAVARHAGIFHASDHVDALSRQSSRRDDVEPYSIEALSRQSSRNEATQQWRRQQQQKPITFNLLIADQPPRFSFSAPPRITSFETVPESDEFKSGGGELASCNASTISRDLLRTTSTVQQCRTEFLTRSPSNKRSVASLESYCKAAGNPVKTLEFLQKNHRSARSKNSSSGRFSTSDVPDMITAAYPFMKVDACGRNSPGRMSVDLLSGRISPELELVRSTSIVEDGELSYNVPGTTTWTSGSWRRSRMKLPVIGLEELKRSKSSRRAASQPNPYSSYDSRFPPAARRHGDRSEVHPPSA
ncbi:hypothetical protein CY35_13G007600 [Sphagnum magellanicum]|nr:hypothetical protein CY35_13G007600 [Sphagnum magellanicum]KAH9542458.1 hypothetical protein CY35_13G007600 [Sphagnum magellanicum]